MNFKQLTNIVKQTLNEFAFERKKAVYEITNLCIPYTTHIIKLSLFSNDYDIPKWKDEIYNFIYQASLYYDLKDSKHLKPRDYMDNFFFGLLETEEELKRTYYKILKELKRQGYTEPENINYKQIFENHNKFVQEVLKVFPDVDYDNIMDLLDKYIKGKAL